MLGSSALRRTVVSSLSLLAFAGLVGADAALGIGASGNGTPRGTAGCTDPVVHDRYAGFHVGVPTGWFLSSTGGLIVVAKDYTLRTEGVVQTAYVRKGQSPKAFLAAVLASMSKKDSVRGNALTYRITSPSTAAITGHVGSVGISGQATVSLLRVQGRIGSELGVVSAYWAPPAQLSAERKKLASVGACYGPEQGTLFRFYHDQAFAYTLPPGWKVGQESSDLLFLNDGPNASANFILEGPFPASQGVTDAQSLLRYSFQKIGLKIDTVLATATGPSQTTRSGATQQEVITEFLGRLGSTKLHGLVRVISDTGGGATSGALRIALATPQLWNSLNGALVWVTYGIQHGFGQDLRAIQQAQQQLAGFSKQVAGFDQALNGTDVVQDPTTGIQYEAPYSAYNRTGPNGPGYYAGSPGKLRKLNVVTPS